MSEWADIWRLVEDFDLEEYLREHGFRQLSDTEWLGVCPECSKEKLAVNAARKWWHCWVCQEYEDYWDASQHLMRRRAVVGAGGLIKLLRLLEDCSLEEAIALLGSRPLWSLRTTEFVPDSNLLLQILDTPMANPILPPDGWEPIYSMLPYLERRAITMEDVRDFGLFQWKNRLVFPVWEDGQLVYWQARAMYEKEDCGPGFKFLKSMNPKRTPGAVVSSDVLMNLDTAARFPRVALVEGPTDVVRTGLDAVCSFGKQLFPAQIARLLRKGVKALDFMWDGPTTTEPEGAQPEMLALVPVLAPLFDLRLVLLPRGDPGDWSRTALLEHRAAAVPASYFSRTASV